MNRRKFVATTAASGAALAVSRLGRATEPALVLQDVKALINGDFKRCDIGISSGRISAIGEPGSLGPAARVIKDQGLYVSPGWVDLHVHYVDWRHGKSAGSSISGLGSRHGVTALLDAGTTGPYNYQRLERAVADDPDVPCYALLNIKNEGIKLTSFYNTRTGWDDIPAMEDVISNHSERIVGLKIRADNSVSARSDRLYYVRKIREAGDRFGLPSMVHIGPPPPDLAGILGLLKEGDVVTHFLRGQGHSIIGDNGKVMDEVKDAYERGVKFDLGHGMGSFSFAAAEAALDQGFVDFTISSDLYIMSKPLYARTFANVLTQFLAMGMGLGDIMERASTRAAPFLGIEREIKEGAQAMLSVFSLAGGDFTCADVVGDTRKSERRIIPEWTVLEDRVVRAGEADRKKFL